MAILITSDPSKNIRVGGTGLGFVQRVGAAGRSEIGEVGSLNFNVEQSTEKLKSSRTAAKATILETVTETNGNLGFGLREWSYENLTMALMGSDFAAQNQVAGHQDLTETTVAQNLYVDVGKRDVFITKVSHGSVSGGPFQVGETITGGTSGATGDVAYVDTVSGYVELVNVSGTFATGETLTGGTSSGEAASSGVESLEDVVVVDAAAPTTRYVQGEDYKLIANGGQLMVLSTGSISGSPYVAFDYPAIEINYSDLLSGTQVEGEFRFMSDPGDVGPRFEIIFHKVRFSLSGDIGLIGDGAAELAMTGTVMADTSKPTAQQYAQIRHLN